jgi:hypothetical protein
MTEWRPGTASGIALAGRQIQKPLGGSSAKEPGPFAGSTVTACELREENGELKRGAGMSRATIDTVRSSVCILY